MSIVMAFAIAFATVGVVCAITAGLGYLVDRIYMRREVRKFDEFIAAQDRKYGR